MIFKILFTAPYMIPFVDRFKPVFDQYDIELIIPDVQERMEEADLLKYAGQFDGTICGDDRYTLRVIEACSPRLKVISKWGTGIDSIDAEACSRYIGFFQARSIQRLFHPGAHGLEHPIIANGFMVARSAFTKAKRGAGLIYKESMGFCCAQIGAKVISHDY